MAGYGTARGQAARHTCEVKTDGRPFISEVWGGQFGEVIGRTRVLGSENGRCFSQRLLLGLDGVD